MTVVKKLFENAHQHKTAMIQKIVKAKIVSIMGREYNSSLTSVKILVTQRIVKRNKKQNYTKPRILYIVKMWQRLH